MTEQEAETWAARLTRIWAPVTDWVTQEDWLPQWSIRGRSFIYLTNVAPTIQLRYDVGQSVRTDRILLLRYQEGKLTGHMACFIQRAEVGLARPRSSENEFLFRQFDTEWRETFRRNCWLSGVDIEASAHEKAEWSQGFSREELDAWNLKI